MPAGGIGFEGWAREEVAQAQREALLITSWTALCKSDCSFVPSEAHRRWEVTITGCFCLLVFVLAEKVKASLQPFKVKRLKEAPQSKSQTRNCHLPSDPTRVPRSGGQGPQVNGMEGGRGNGDCQEWAGRAVRGTGLLGVDGCSIPPCPLYDSPLHSGEPKANN